MKNEVSKGRFIVRFKKLSTGEANLAADSLKQFLDDLGEPAVSVETRRDASGTQDFGATLVLVLGTQAAVAVAKGIANWLERRSEETSLVILEANGNRVIARGSAAKSIDVSKTAAALRGKRKTS